MFLIANLSFQQILFNVFGGLGLFLFGIHIMGDSLKNLASSKLKIIIEKTTNTPIKGIVTGMILTAFLQSSSGVTVIIIGLISANLMTLPQAVATIMGANIGTTITSIMIGFNIGAYSLPIIAIGALICFFIKNKRFYLIGTTILGFGLLFYGLELMGGTLKEVAKEPFFTNLMTSFSKSPALGVLTGSIVTAIIQSSSASIGILQQIYQNGDITLLASISVLLGCNIGTTITALITSLGANKNAKRAAYAHLFFNLFGAIIFLIILRPFTNLISSAERHFTFLQASPAATIALAHVIFNFLTAIVLFFLINYFVKIIVKLFPYSESEQKMAMDVLEHSLIKKAPALALENAHKVIIDMGETVEHMFTLAKRFINEFDKRIPEEIQNYEDIVDTYDNKIHDYLVKIPTTAFGVKEMKLHAIYFDTIGDLERIADHAMNLVEFMSARYANNCVFYDESLEMINHMLELLTNMINDAQIAFKNYDKNAARRIRATEPQIDELEKKYRRHESNLASSGIITPNEDMHFVDILSNLERIGDHANNISDNILFESIHEAKDFKKSTPI